jgi:hypothetical protein
VYPPELKESIARIEITREKRLKEDYPRLTEKDQSALIRQYHPNCYGGNALWIFNLSSIFKVQLHIQALIFFFNFGQISSTIVWKLFSSIIDLDVSSGFSNF